MRQDTSSSGRLIWDLPLRLMHGLLIVGVALAWLTQNLSADYFDWHRRSGYLVLFIVISRLIWGWCGPRYARFRQFIKGPAWTWDYARDLLRPGARRHCVGHNPLGGWMVLLMLALLFVQAVTGLVANDQIMNSGPLFGYVSEAFSNRMTKVHKLVVNVLLAAIAVHIVAVLFYLLVKKQNLIVPMITGRKPVAQLKEGAGIDRSMVARAILVWVIVALMLALLVRSAPQAALGAWDY
ncbi:MAG: cytochrome b/b6 domain-containing protein [Steroidobacteraceae bacterium]